VGCVARVGFTAAEVDGFKKGGKATLTIVPAVAPDKTVALEVSLKGFTAGFDAVAAAQAAAEAAEEEEGEEEEEVDILALLPARHFVLYYGYRHEFIMHASSEWHRYELLQSSECHPQYGGWHSDDSRNSYRCHSDDACIINSCL